MRPRTRDVLAGVIAIALGLLIITYGVGGDLGQACVVASLFGAFGSTARIIN